MEGNWCGLFQGMLTVRVFVSTICLYQSLLRSSLCPVWGHLLNIGVAGPEAGSSSVACGCCLFVS